MVEDAQVARDDLVLEPGAVGDVDSVSVVRHDDHRALRSQVSRQNTGEFRGRSEPPQSYNDSQKYPISSYHFAKLQIFV